MSSIRVLLLSNDYVVHTGLKSIFEGNDIKVVGNTSSTENIWPIAHRVKPEVVLLDIDGTEDDPGAMLQRLHPEKIAILVMSRHNSTNRVQHLLEAGALGYILTSETTTEMIVAAVRTVAGGGQWLSPRLGAQVVRELRGGGRFTQREREVLRLLAQGRPDKHIAETMATSERTVRAHTRKLKDKIGVEKRAELVAWTIEQAYQK